MAIMEMCPICPGGLVWMDTPDGLACGECGFVPKHASEDDETEPGDGGPQPEDFGVTRSIYTDWWRTLDVRMLNGMAYAVREEVRTGRTDRWAVLKFINALIAWKSKIKNADHNIVDEPELTGQSSSHTDIPMDAVHPAGEQHQKFIEAPGLETEFQRKGKYITESFLRAYAHEEPSSKDRITIGGLPVVVEWNKGSTRSGQDRDGEKWSRKMYADYGYIHDTEGEDGEGVDVYIGPHLDSDKVFVIEQIHDGDYDEDKCMIGFDSEEEAEDCYRKHFPDDGKDFFGGIRTMSLDTFLTGYLAWSQQKKEKYKKKAEVGQSLVTLTEGTEDSRPVDRRDVSEAYHGDNINEDKDLHLGMVEAPYSSGHGPSSIHEDENPDDKKVVMQSTASLGRGLDPYRVGSIYSYSQLIPQHQHEIDINWKKGKGRHFLWLRTAIDIPTLVKESDRWYQTNRNRKWGFTDSQKVVALAEIMMDGGTITPLLVSPVGEKNGGVWEGYHRLRAADMLDWHQLPVIMKIDPTECHWQEKVAQQEREPWICVDLDGTILEEDPNAHKRDDTRPPLGEPYQGVAEQMRELMNIGRVSIYTARQYFEDDGNGWQEEIREHLEQHKIPFDDIYVGKKPPADVFIDNKNIRFEGEWAGMADLVRSILTKDKYREQPHHEISMEAALGGHAPKRAIVRWMAPDGADHSESFDDPYNNVDYLYLIRRLEDQGMQYKVEIPNEKQGQIPPAHVLDKLKHMREERLLEDEGKRRRVEIHPPPPPDEQDDEEDKRKRAYASGGPGNQEDSKDSYTNVDGSRDDLAVKEVV